MDPKNGFSLTCVVLRTRGRTKSRFTRVIPSVLSKIHLRRCYPLLLGMALGVALNSPAGIRVWTGGGADANWSTAANWGGNPIAAGDDLIFPSQATQLDNNNDLPSDTAFSSITLSGSGYVIHGNALALSSASGIEAQNATGTNILNVRVQLDTDLAFECAQAGAVLIVNGDVDLQNHALTNNATGIIQLAGIVSGTGSLFKIGPGTLRLSGASDNTFSGPAEVREGLLELGKTGASALRDNASLTVGDEVGGADADIVRYVANGNQINSSVAVTVSSSGLLDLNGFNDKLGPVTMIGGDIRTETGMLDLTGPLTVNTNITRQSRINGRVNLPETLVLDVTGHHWSPEIYLFADISGPGGITKEGPGEIDLYGLNGFEGVFTINGGGVNLESDTACGVTSSGTIVNSGARVVLLSGIHIDGEALDLHTNGTSSDAGSLWAGYGSNSWTGPVTLDGSTTVRVYNKGDQLTLSGNITGNGNLTKIAGGRLLLAASANNSFVGSTIVQGGTLIVDSLQPQVPAMVQSGAVLGGSGTVGAITVSSGTVAPGTSPGILTSGDVMFNDSTTFAVEMNGTRPGNGYDQLDVAGTVNLGNSMLDVSMNYPTSIGSVFTLINNDGTDGVNGTFAGLAEGATFDVNGVQFRISYTGGDGNDVTLTQLSAFSLPTLTIERNAPNGVRVLWPTNFSGFALQATTNLDGNHWSAITTLPAVDGTDNVITQSLEASNRFYRLVNPPQ